MASLKDLEAEFLIIIDEKRLRVVDNMADAQGVRFLCPKCFEENRGPIGTHGIICWFQGRGVPDETTPRPGRWIPDGNGMGDLTFIGPKAGSVGLMGGCRWHGFVRNGAAA